jgi:hypothetical protein
MNKNYNFRDIYLDNYYSPFPRQKSNKEALKYSHAKKLPGNKTIIDIPPSVTLSYMKKNPIYFDTKKYSNRILKGKRRPKTARNKYDKNKLTKYQKNFYSKKKNVINNCTVYENKKLEEIFSNSKNEIISERKKLSNELEKIPSYITRPMNPRPKITPNEALKILNKINFPSPPKNKNIPDYINEFKIRNFIEREYERLVDEEKGYPPGTFKVWEEDRILILTNLFLIREELLDILRHFPVDYFLRSIGIINRRRETEKKLDEIDYAIRIFQLTDVYLKM